MKKENIQDVVWAAELLRVLNNAYLWHSHDTPQFVKNVVEICDEAAKKIEAEIEKLD